MAFLPYGPGADKPEPMSRVVDDGAVELSDTTVRALPSAEMEGSMPASPAVMVVGCGVAGAVLLGALSASKAASASLLVGGDTVCTVHDTAREGTVVVNDVALDGIGGSFFDALLDAVKPEACVQWLLFARFPHLVHDFAVPSPAGYWWCTPQQSLQAH